MALVRSFRGGMRRLSTTVAGLVALLVALLTLPFALAPYAEAYIYWTNPSSIGRANLDGAGTDQRFIPVKTPIASGQWKVAGLALDARHVYWAVGCYPGPSAPPCTSGAIGRANLDGSGVKQSLIGGIDPGGVAVDADYIYWTESFCDGSCSGGDRVAWAIGRANLDGTTVDRSFIVTGRSPVTGSNTIGVAGNDLALDAEHIYWTGRLFAPACCGATLSRANLDGIGVDPMFIPGPCCMKAPGWTGITVDDAHIYWTEHLSDPQVPSRSIRRANLDGSGSARFILPGGDESFDPGALAVDGLTDRKLAGKVSAAKTQRQRGKGIVVRVKVRAKEKLTAKATGEIKVNPTYKLKAKKVKLAAGETRTLKLKPKKAAAKKITAALKRGKATAKLKMKLSDVAGNSKTEKLRVKLKG